MGLILYVICRAWQSPIGGAIVLSHLAIGGAGHCLVLGRRRI